MCSVWRGRLRIFFQFIRITDGNFSTIVRLCFKLYGIKLRMLHHTPYRRPCDHSLLLEFKIFMIFAMILTNLPRSHRHQRRQNSLQGGKGGSKVISWEQNRLLFKQEQITFSEKVFLCVYLATPMATSVG